MSPCTDWHEHWRQHLSVILTNYLTMSGSFEHCVLFASLPTFTVNPNYEENKYSFSGRWNHSSQLWESAWDAKWRQRELCIS